MHGAVSHFDIVSHKCWTVNVLALCVTCTKAKKAYLRLVFVIEFCIELI